VELFVDLQRGSVRCLYGESIGLATLGRLAIERASQVEPDGEGAWWADLAPVRGPRLGPYDLRSDALAAETAWLTANVLESPPEPDASYP
jgi:hypothetical protein